MQPEATHSLEMPGQIKTTRGAITPRGSNFLCPHAQVTTREILGAVGLK